MSKLVVTENPSVVRVEGSYVKKFALGKKSGQVKVWLNDSMDEYIGIGTTPETFEQMKNFSGGSWTGFFRNQIMNGTTYKFERV